MFLALAVMLCGCALFEAQTPRVVVPEYLKSAVVYQIVLRTFTREGNFKAATEMLEHVRSVGVDVVYLAPFVEMDRDMDVKGWSPRQIKSGFHSPKNPYRISNYDRIDPEYGDDADFREFCDKAHTLGMKVFMDLVYVHCGPNNVIKDMFSDAFQKNPDGTVKTTEWRFPYLNFDSQGVRKYLVDSMLRWMRLGCDGFRCDTGDKVPLDFWEEAAETCRVVNPALVMINEGVRPECLQKAFNARYDWHWGRLRGYLVPAAVAKPMTLPQIMEEVREYDAEVPDGGLSFVFLDNHDTAADAGENRFDRVLPVEAGNAAFVLTFLRRGLPLLFNGNEIADNSLSTFFAPVEDPARARKTVDWSRALQPAGQKRLSLLRRLAKLRHEMPAFSEGTQEWMTGGEMHGCVSFMRRHGGVGVFVAANLTDKAAEFCAEGSGACVTDNMLLAERGSLASDGTCRLGPWGYVVSACAFSAVKEEVKVSDFGWDADDATKCVQSALNSGARRVVFDRQSGPWVVTPVKARSDTEIVFEDGVELRAKRGEFHDQRDYLLDFTHVTNVTLIGRGVKGGILRMNKADYQKSPYKPSEWRHALAILGATNVRVENMSFIASGGDGICVGRHSRDVVVRHCVCDGNHRQGISICAVENLLIENTVLRNTHGTLPQAGIDFEPDSVLQSIANCTMRNCRIEGNAGSGIDVYLVNQKGRSLPIGLKVENCVITGNVRGTSVTVGGKNRYVDSPRGEICFSNCTFASNRNGGIVVNGKPPAFPLAFVDCVVSNEAKGVSFACAGGWETPLPDGVEFRNMTVHCANGQSWFTVGERGLDMTIPTNITGSVSVVRPDGCRNQVVLDASWRHEMFSTGSGETPPERIKTLPDATNCVLHDEQPGQMVKMAPLELLWGARYVFFADSPGKVRFCARQIPKNEGQMFCDERKIAINSNGKRIAELSTPGLTSQTYVVTIPRRGFYRIVAPAYHARFLLEESDVPVALDLSEKLQQAYFSDAVTHPVWFGVSPQTAKAAFIAHGGSEGPLTVEVSSPYGSSAWKNAEVKTWSAFVSQNPAVGLWQVDLCAQKRYFRIDLAGVPGLLWLSKTKTVLMR